MYEFLKALFGTNEDGTPKALTFEQLSAAIAANKELKLVNLADGGYVAKDKFDAKVTELEGIQTQLTDANAQIQSYKDMDIDGIKASVKDWETKYNTDTAALQQKLKDQETEFAARNYLSGFKYANDLVKDAIYEKFMAKGFARENDKFLGADDFMAEMQKNNPSAFIVDTPPADHPANDPPAGQNPAANAPFFTSQNPPQQQTKKRTLAELMKYKNEHPDAQINYD